MTEHLKTAGLIGLLLAAMWGVTRIPGTFANYDYECVKTGKVKAERCVAEESKHILNDATGNCVAQSLVSMSGSEYCHRCETLSGDDAL